MIVELAGAPGAGKTTLAALLASQLGGVPLSARLSPGSSTSQTVRNLMKTPAAAVRTISNSEARACLSVVRGSIAARSAFPFRYGRIMSAMRRLARHARASRHSSIVHLVDEGVLGIVDLAFSGGNVPSPQEIFGVTSTIPVSDVIVFLQGPIDLLARRALERSDGPREWKSLSAPVIGMRIETIQEILRATVAAPRFFHAIVIDAPESENDLATAAVRVRLEMARIRSAAAAEKIF